MEQLFWNRSVRRVVLLPGAEDVDFFRSPRLSVTADGRLLRDGRGLTGSLLIDGYGGTIMLADAERLASSQSFTLWRTNGPGRLSLYLAGRYSDGWLSGVGRMYLWPSAPGTPIRRRVSLTLTAPTASDGMTIRFTEPGKRAREVRLEPGRPRSVTFDVCSRAAWPLPYL